MGNPHQRQVFHHFFQNVTNFGERTWNVLESRYLDKFRTISFAEHHLNAPRLNDTISKLAKANFCASGCVAKFTNRSDKGTSGGVMSLVRSGFKAWMPDVYDAEAQIDPSLFQGNDWHIVVVGCKGYAVSVATIYLSCGLGFQSSNITKLAGLVAALKVLGRPYVIVGDFNVDPAVAKSQGIEHYADAKIMVPSNVNYTFSAKSLIDYALVSQELFGVVKLEAALDTPWASHLGLVVSIPTRAREVLGRFQIKPRSFPHVENRHIAEKNLGKVFWDDSIVGEGAFVFGDGVVNPLDSYVLAGSEWCDEALDNATSLRNLSLQTEDYFCRLYEVPPPHWAQFGGRAGGIRLKVRPLLPDQPLHHPSAPPLSGHLGPLYNLRSRLLEVARLVAKKQWVGRNHSLFLYMRFKLRNTFHNLFHPLLNATHYADLALVADFLLDIHSPSAADVSSNIARVSAIISFLEKSHYETKTKAYRDWLNIAHEKACKLGHAYVKKHERPAALPATSQSHHDPVELMDKKAMGWARYWSRDVANADKISAVYNLARKEALKQDFDSSWFSVARVSAVIHSSRKGRATSLDCISMSDLLSLPREAIATLASLLKSVGEGLAMPAQLLSPAVGLIPKPKSSGDRPITITSVVYMLLIKLIDQSFSSEADKICQFWDTAVKGSSALSSALHRCVLDEIAVNEGAQAVTAHWDIEKFYDNINIEKLILRLVSCNIPLRAPVLALQMHVAPRVLTMQNWLSMPQQVCTSIIAGCKLSNVFAKLFVFPALHEWHLRIKPAGWPESDFNCTEGPMLKEYVDDFTLRQKISTRSDLSLFVQANVMFADSIASLDLVLSKKKSALVGARADAALTIQRAIKARGHNLTRLNSIEDLGVQTSGSRRRLGSTLVKRTRQVRKRVLKLSEVVKGNRGLVNVLKTGVWPAASYGHAAQGSSPTQTDLLREMFAGATGVAGVDICPRTALALSLDDVDDPLVKAAKEQIKFWIDFWINNAPLHLSINKYWGVTWQRLKGDKDRWKKARGPIAATICVLLDLQWLPMRADLWKDTQGMIFALRGSFHYDPRRRRLVAQHGECTAAIERDALNLVWDGRNDSDNNKGPKGAYDVHTIKSLHKFLVRKDRKCLAGALLMGVCDGVPDQSKLHEKGLVDSPLCLRCKKQPDSPKHRLWECSANACSQDIAIKSTQRLQQFVEDDNAMLWNRGLIGLSLYPKLQETDWSRDFWCGNQELLPTVSVFYSDGSGGPDSSDPFIRRCGWGFVGLANGHIVFGQGGGLVGPKQTVPRAELFALLQIAKSRPAGSACRVGVDCQYLIDGASGSRHKAANGSNGDLWDEYFSVLDPGSLDINLFKVKSHRKYEDIVLGFISVIEFVGNAAADAFAKRGAELWTVPDERKLEIKTARSRAWRVGMRLAAVVAETVAAFKEAPLLNAIPVKPRRTVAHLRHELESLGHCIEVEGRRASCFRCGITFLFNGTQCRALLNKGKCKAVSAPNDQISKGFASSSTVLGEVQVSEDVSVERDDVDPSDFGNMDLDGNFFSPPPAPLVEEQTDCTSVTFETHERRTIEGGLFIGVKSADPVHHTHRMMYWAGIFFCSTCGCWGTVKTRFLVQPCRQCPSRAGACALKRIHAGLPPPRPPSLRGV